MGGQLGKRVGLLTHQPACLFLCQIRKPVFHRRIGEKLFVQLVIVASGFLSCWQWEVLPWPFWTYVTILFKQPELVQRGWVWLQTLSQKSRCLAFAFIVIFCPPVPICVHKTSFSKSYRLKNALSFPSWRSREFRSHDSELKHARTVIGHHVLRTWLSTSTDTDRRLSWLPLLFCCQIHFNQCS